MDESGVTLDSGLRAIIRHDPYSSGGYELVVGGTPQSHVDLDNPEYLLYEYVRRMGHFVDLLPPGAITAIHLGAGALTLPRYIATLRPGSRQQVIELEKELVDLVRATLPLPRGAAIRVRYGDARAVLGRLPAALRGAADLLVVDVFAGDRIPGHVTSLEFYRECLAFLAPAGILLVNVADGAGSAFARGQAATVRMAVDDPIAGGSRVAVVAEPAVLKGRRFGNLVIAASPTALPLDWMPRLVTAGPFPAALVHGRELQDWIAGAPVVTDATASGSPPARREMFIEPPRGER